MILVKFQQYLLTASILLFLHLGWYQLSAQGIPYQGPEDPAGDVAALRGGYMNGNNTYLYYLNNLMTYSLFPHYRTYIRNSTSLYLQR